jgi:hypothetical protein
MFEARKQCLTAPNNEKTEKTMFGANLAQLGSFQASQMIRQRQRNAGAEVQEGPPEMQRRPEPQTAFGDLPTQAASLQAPQVSALA